MMECHLLTRARMEELRKNSTETFIILTHYDVIITNEQASLKDEDEMDN